MSVLMQRLGRLRSVYSMLLRGSDNSNFVHWMHGALPKHKYSTSSVARIDSEKILGVHASTPDIGNKNENENNSGLEKIQENGYAHNFFMNSWKYEKIVMRPSTTYAHVTNKEALKILEQDWNWMTNAEIVSAVKKLSYNFSYNNEEKIELLQYAEAFSKLKMEKLTNDELMTIMRHLVLFNSMKHLNFYFNLCKLIDNECMKRFLKLPIEQTLYLCDIIYQMTHGINHYFSQYMWYSIRKIGNKPQKLSPQQLVQVLFFLNVHRKPPMNMYEFEYHLEQCKDELSINELGIAALGFFKTSTKIQSADFLNYIIQRSVAEINEMHSVSIGSIIKLVRYSINLTQLKSLLDLLKALTPYEPHYTLSSLTHIAQACGRIAVYNKELMDRIITRLNKELKIARLKNFERLLYTFVILDIDSSNSVYQNVIEELRTTWNTTRQLEIQKYPSITARILGYLATKSIFPLDLIRYVMAPEFVSRSCHGGDYYSISREYLVLDYCLRIEVPEYDGPFLKPTLKSSLEKKYLNLYLKSNSSSTRANMLFSNVLATCQELFNNKTDISIIRPLPYFLTQDIVLCLNEQNQLMPSKKYFSQFEETDIKRVDKEKSNNVRWIVLVLGHHGLLVRNCQNRPTGALASKMRQLSIIGYKPVMISCMTWDTLQSPQEKCKYIKSLIMK